VCAAISAYRLSRRSPALGCSSPAEHCRVGITAHRGQRQTHDGGWQLSRDPRDPDPQMLLLHSSPVAPLRRAPRAMV
jgi:hypothetical protein